MQDCSNPIASALELLQSCTKPSIFHSRKYISNYRLQNGSCRDFTISYNISMTLSIIILTKDMSISCSAEIPPDHNPSFQNIPDECHIFAIVLLYMTTLFTLIVLYMWQGQLLTCIITHLGILSHICVIEIVYYWFRWKPGAYFMSKHQLNCLEQISIKISSIAISFQEKLVNSLWPGDAIWRAI